MAVIIIGLCYAVYLEPSGMVLTHIFRITKILKKIPSYQSDYEYAIQNFIPAIDVLMGLIAVVIEDNLIVHIFRAYRYNLDVFYRSEINATRKNMTNH